MDELTPDIAAEEAPARPALRSSTPDVERLYVSNFDGYNSGSLIEVRSSSPASRTIGGYAAVFNRMSENLGGFREKIAPLAGFPRRRLPLQPRRLLSVGNHPLRHTAAVGG